MVGFGLLCFLTESSLSSGTFGDLIPREPRPGVAGKGTQSRLLLPGGCNPRAPKGTVLEGFPAENEG